MGFAAFMAYVRSRTTQEQQQHNRHQRKEDELRHQLFEGRKRMIIYCQWLEEFDTKLQQIHKGQVNVPYPKSLEGYRKPLNDDEVENKNKRKSFLTKTCPAFKPLNTDYLIDMTDLNEVF